MKDLNITAKIICDSINDNGNRLTTFVCTFPRIILAEVNTHRMLSRNSASSRAIPVEKQISKVLSDPFIPSYVGKNQKGMQAHEEIEDKVKATARLAWINSSEDAVISARQLVEMGAHKQLANRLLEPFIYTTAIISATEWINFFKLRAHPDAQPEFQILAFKMLEAYLESKPKFLPLGWWHLPFGDRMEPGLSQEEKIKIAVARCARVSYENFDGEININSDFKIYDSLSGSGHWSPFEHVAFASDVKGLRSGNFRGFVQHRSQLEKPKFVDLKNLLNNKPSWINE